MRSSKVMSIVLSIVVGWLMPLSLRPVEWTTALRQGVDR